MYIYIYVRLQCSSIYQHIYIYIWIVPPPWRGPRSDNEEASASRLCPQQYLMCLQWIPHIFSLSVPIPTKSTDRKLHIIGCVLLAPARLEPHPADWHSPPSTACRLAYTTFHSMPIGIHLHYIPQHADWLSLYIFHSMPIGFHYIHSTACRLAHISKNNVFSDIILYIYIYIYIYIFTLTQIYIYIYSHIVLMLYMLYYKV